ncbi:adenylate cyclase [Rhizobium tubonense]|uniref:Adenylate cyclase n=1 Tax=Rhizobium tubonense TaxID=484088 RepID=A0A2W4CVR2_9HYPH|nr:adenylate cyclase [Rhizobium tubonense]PZM14385.1 adenylate cyclase [Rhizobium tubonense]
METGVPGGEDGSTLSRPPPSPEEIRNQLARILASPQFPGSVGRSAIFLSYVVKEFLAGRAQRIKGYTVGIEVFGRAEGNTQDDPVVRIEAGRLRRSLEHYYLTDGQRDPIRIDIPKGGYVPTFTWACSAAEPVTGANSAAKMPDATPFSTRPAKVRFLILATICCGVFLAGWLALRPASSPRPSATAAADVSPSPRVPTLTIASFADLGEGTQAKPYAVGLTEELLTTLPRFKELRVLGREASQNLPNVPNLAQARRELGAQYLLAGGVRIVSDKAHVTARLLDTTTGTILWSQIYDDDLQSRSLLAIQTDVANRVSTAVAQPYGIISQADSAALTPNDLDAYACTLRFYGYRAAPSIESHTQVRECLETAVARFPSYSTAFAMLSMTYLDESRFWFNHAASTDTKPALERALLAARRAVLLDPENTRAQQSLMGALFLSRQVADALRVGEQAMTINPNDTELMGEYGSFLGQSGNWERGAEVLRIVLSLNPGGGGYYRGDLGLSEYMQGNYADAADEIRQADLQKFPLFHGVAAIIFAENGNAEDAAREAAKFSEMGAAFLANLDFELAQRIDRPEDRARIRKSLIKAGVRIPDAVAEK